MDSRIEGTDRMGSEGSEMKAKESAGLDRVGRILVRFGSLVAVVFVVLPALGFALVSLGLAQVREEGGFLSCTSLDCSVEVVLGTTLPVAGVAVAVIVTIVMTLRGGTVSLTLGGIAAFIIGAATFVLLPQEGDDPIWLAAIAVVGAGFFALALGAAFRLVARRQAQGGQ
jgi:hypothetical protein